MSDDLNIKALSAEYAFESDSAERKKFTYNPKQFDYVDNAKVEAGDKTKGYSFVHHDPLKDGEDEAFANHTFMGLGDSVDFSGMAVQREVDLLDLCLFTALKAPNGKYLKNVDGKLYAITEENEQLTDANMFKIYKSYDSRFNEYTKDPRNHRWQNGFVVSQGTKFATVKTFMGRFNIEMKELIPGDRQGIQHFGVYQIPGTNRITIYSLMFDPWRVSFLTGNTKNPFDIDSDCIKKYNIFPKDSEGKDISPHDGLHDDAPLCTYETSGGTTPHIDKDDVYEYGADAHAVATIKYVKRFWSLYDGYDSDLKKPDDRIPPAYPKYIYESDVPYENMVKVNGIIFNNKYTAKETLQRVGNNYLFECEFLKNNDERYIMVGYDGKIRWVKYFNDFYDKFFNLDVTPDKIIEDVKPSVIFECPYKAVMTDDGMKLNFVELKNVMTPGYTYTVTDKEKETTSNG